MQFLGIFFFIGMVIEFTTLFLMVSWVGGLATLGLIVLSFVVGGALLRNNMGISKVMMAGQLMRGNGMSFYDMMLPIRVPFAGLLLAMPTGFLSSLLGLLLLIPFKGGKSHTTHTDPHFSGGFQYTTRPKPDDDNVIEGEYTVKSSHNKSTQPNDIIEHQK